MPDDPASEAFALRYSELQNSGAGQALNVHKEGATGTFGWLIDEYLRSALFRRLDKLTQDNRRQLLEATRAEVVTPDNA